MNKQEQIVIYQAKDGQTQIDVQIQNNSECLYHPGHPVRFAVETLDSIEEVMIIKEALK